jgi:presenilin-like A22 family membrane protease
MDNQTKEEQVFHAGPILLVPVAASLIVGVLCASLIILSEVAFPTATPLPEVGLGPIVNAAIFVVLTGFGASMIYLFLKHKKRGLIRFLIGFAITVVTFFLSNVYLLMLLSLLNAGNIELLALADSILITIVVDLELFALHNVGGEMIILALGGALGTFLGAAIPTFSAILILLFLAVYDIVSVFRGPVGKMASEGLEYLHGLSFSFKDIQMGLGDLTFYSMLAGHALIFFGFWASVGGIVGILIGSFLSFKMLEKKGMFPGLPFSIALGLLGVFTVVVL